MMREIVIASGARTAIGSFGGSLKDIPPTELGAITAREALRRAGVSGEQVDHVVFAQVMHTDASDPYISRVVGMRSGIPESVPALTVNRLCGSGLQAIVTAAQLIRCGDADIVLAGGAESMSRVPYWLTGARWGYRLGHAQTVDALLAALHDPFHACHMGAATEILVKRYGITREDQDRFALESHRRAAKAREEGVFTEEIVPVEVKRGKEVVLFNQDEHIRPDTSLEKLAALPPVFQEGGTVTAGNSSGINDGAASVVVMGEDVARKLGIEPMARLVSYGFGAVEPLSFGIGPVPAIKQALSRAGLRLDDIDVMELNEAFAGQALAVMKELEMDPERTNPHGGAVALGHPVGATGAILTVKALHDLRRRKLRYALVTMCIGGGQGIAAIFERI
ncbi:MAG: beta-ketothiolase BktB [Armatimonadota bacterium]|nr:beta-ketothiolase BktB [Armatimonadota bacterium]